MTRKRAATTMLNKQASAHAISLAVGRSLVAALILLLLSGDLHLITTADAKVVYYDVSAYANYVGDAALARLEAGASEIMDIFQKLNRCYSIFLPGETIESSRSIKGTAASANTAAPTASTGETMPPSGSRNLALNSCPTNCKR